MGMKHIHLIQNGYPTAGRPLFPPSSDHSLKVRSQVPDFFVKIHLFLFYLWEWLFECTFVSYVHAMLVEARKEHWFPSEGWEPPCKCWELNPNRLKKQPEFSYAESELQPLSYYLLDTTRASLPMSPTTQTLLLKLLVFPPPSRHRQVSRSNAVDSCCCSTSMRSLMHL